jgi:flagellar export protein FliJ
VRKYQFHLQPVLNHRVTVEEIKHRVHMSVQNELKACLARVEALLREIRATMEFAETSSDPEHKMRCEAYVVSLEREIEQLASDRKGIEARLEAARLDLVAASQGLKVIERVHERDFDKWQAEHARAEQAELDEIAILRHGRKK